MYPYLIAALALTVVGVGLACRLAARELDRYDDQGEPFEEDDH